MPGTVPDPPLQSAQIILVFEEEGFLFFRRNVFGYYKGVDQALFQVLFRLYQGSARPTKVFASPVPS